VDRRARAEGPRGGPDPKHRGARRDRRERRGVSRDPGSGGRDQRGRRRLDRVFAEASSPVASQGFAW
jgi:hypothetical protein